MDIVKSESKTNITLPFFTSPVSAGFPSPATDEIEGKLDLNQLLIKHPVATFFVRVQGDSMKDAGIFNGDLLIVDKSLEAKHDDIIVAVLDGEFTVKRMQKKGSKLFLKPENDSYKLIEIIESMEFKVWGVVTSVIKQLKNKII